MCRTAAGDATRRSSGYTRDFDPAWLIEEIPELEDAYKREMEWWGQENPGPHIIYGDVLTPYIIQLLESGEQANKRVFCVLETMLADQDIEVQAVAVVTVFEPLVGSRDWRRSIKPFAGPQAREAVRDLIEGSESEQGLVRSECQKITCVGHLLAEPDSVN